MSSDRVLNRRQFLGLTGAALVAATLEGWRAGPAFALDRAATAAALDMRRGASELVAQPLLMYNLAHRREATTWRPWGGVQTEQAVNQEARRIGRELRDLCASADFAVRTLPVTSLAGTHEVPNLRETPADVLLVYAAGGGTDTLDALAGLGKPMIVFVRQDSGPYYLWHEIVHARFLRSHTDRLAQTNVDFEDVVVDDNAEILWRLRALFGLKNTLGRRIVCVGGPGGWACPQAPDLARERFDLDMVTVPIPELNAMIEAGREDARLMERCRRDAQAYLSPHNVTLETTREAVTEAFLLAELFRDLMRESKAYAIRTNGCMGSYAGIMPCLTLSLVNDAGNMAYCESDFVVIPSGILMHYISGRPAYLCNPTYPHEGRMLFAHCAAPRRMDGNKLEPVRVVTHFESDHGAATKVEFRKGQVVTIIKPD
ncbi:MAG: sugar isomerase, partial [Armatimonadota bacterium]